MRFAAAVVACLFVAQAENTAHAQEMGVLRNLSENTFAPVPGLPSCITLAMESGDSAKGPSVMIFKGTAGCVVPRHWHTPTEHVLIVNGSAKVEMDGGKTAVLGPGGYAMMPSKHVHRFTCPSACLAFVTSDAAFDIHYVDENGKELSPEAALASKK